MLPPLRIQITSTGSPGFCPTSAQPGYEIASRLGFTSLLEQLPEFGETSVFTSSLKEVRKDSGEHPSEEIRRARSKRGLASTAASVPTELRRAIPVRGCVCPPGSSPNHVLSGFLWRLPHGGTVNYELHFQPHSPLWRGEEVAENSKRPITDQRPAPSHHLIGTKYAPRLLSI